MTTFASKRGTPNRYCASNRVDPIGSVASGSCLAQAASLKQASAPDRAMIHGMKAALSSCIVVLTAFAPTPGRGDCQCLANGRTFHHGDIACLQLPEGPELAQCGMVLNNSSWKKIQDGCPEASNALNHAGVSETASRLAPPVDLRLHSTKPHLLPEQDRS